MILFVAFTHALCVLESPLILNQFETKAAIVVGQFWHLFHEHAFYEAFYKQRTHQLKHFLVKSSEPIEIRADWLSQFRSAIDFLLIKSNETRPSIQIMTHLRETIVVLDYDLSFFRLPFLTIFKLPCVCVFLLSKFDFVHIWKRLIHSIALYL